MLDQLNDLLRPIGLFMRGGFYPADCDGVPGLRDGEGAQTVVLIGNAGAPLWEAFAASADRSVRNPLDSWLTPLIERVANEIGATPVLPNRGPPYPPIQDWAAKAEPVYRSPIGIMIHPDYGLWHVYRAAFLFPDRIELPPRIERASPCESCVKKPCLSVCPADAFLPDRFDAVACASHVKGATGTNCLERGCLARRACPVGREHLYVPEQQAFHTAAMLRAVERYMGPGSEESVDGGEER